MSTQMRNFILIGVSISLVACRSPTPQSNAQPKAQTAISGGSVSRIADSSSPTSPVEYKVYTLARSVVHTVSIPPQSQVLVTAAVSGTVEPIGALAQRYGAIAAINGGYFDPENQQSISPVTLQGNAVAKPEDNQRLMTNPTLLPYLDKILNRSEFRRYQCGTVVQYDITRRQTVPRADCQIQDSLGAGPQLLPNATLEEEGFLEIRNQKIIRDPLGVDQPNARSAIGITRNNTIIWVMVAQKPETPGDSGMTIRQLTDLMKTLGVEKAMNLDGGSSASLYYRGKTISGKMNESGKPIGRSIKSALLIQPIKKPEN